MNENELINNLKYLTDEDRKGFFREYLPMLAKSICVGYKPKG